MRDLAVRWRTSLKFMPSIKDQHVRERESNVIERKMVEGDDMESEPVMVPSGKYCYQKLHV